MKFGYALIDRTSHGRGAARLRRATQRNVSLPGEQTGRGIQTNPSAAGQIHFAPRVQVGEIHLGAARAVERLHVGRELDEIATDEPCRESHRAHHFHEQPGGIAARAARLGQRVLRRLHAGFEADGVLDGVLNPLVDLDEKINRPRAFLQILREQFIHEREQPGRGRGQFHERREFLLQPRVVGEGILLRRVFEKKVERVVNRHLRDQFDLDAQLGAFFREDEASVPVGERILLPVQEMFLGLNLQRVAEDARPAMGRGPQPHDMRRVPDLAVVGVMGPVLEGDVNGHFRNPKSEGRRTKGASAVQQYHDFSSSFDIRHSTFAPRVPAAAAPPVARSDPSQPWRRRGKCRR